MAGWMGATTGAAAGSSPPTPVIQPDSRDDSALIWVGTGSSSTTAGTLVTITLGANYPSGGDFNAGEVPDTGMTPKFLVTFIGSAAQAAGCYVSSITTYSVVIACATAPATGLSATTSGIGIVIHMDA